MDITVVDDAWDVAGSPVAALDGVVVAD